MNWISQFIVKGMAVAMIIQNILLHSLLRIIVQTVLMHYCACIGLKVSWRLHGIQHFIKLKHFANAAGTKANVSFWYSFPLYLWLAVLIQRRIKIIKKRYKIMEWNHRNSKLFLFIYWYKASSFWPSTNTRRIINYKDTTINGVFTVDFFILCVNLPFWSM